MKAKLTFLILLLAAPAVVAETHVSIGVHVGDDGYGYYPPPPPPMYVYEPPCPGPGYLWVPGTYYRVGPRYSWRSGYWTPPRHHGWRGGHGYRDSDWRGEPYRGKYRKEGYRDRGRGRDRGRWSR
ncbi:MAG TPA: hypothetical protein VN442_09315 [Bryobacteraceae bacterium]|nr:hypothetical protein [Bryobacteraceae bacterium]